MVLGLNWGGASWTALFVDRVRSLEPEHSQTYCRCHVPHPALRSQDIQDLLTLKSMAWDPPSKGALPPPTLQDSTGQWHLLARGRGAETGPWAALPAARGQPCKSSAREQNALPRSQEALRRGPAALHYCQ